MASILNAELVLDRYSTMIHADSHGSSGPHLGLGALYYGFSHAVKSQVSVCIGSGAGFVPGLLRQTQLDLDLTPSVTYLIDANLPDLGFGGPSLPGGWLTGNNDFLSWAEGVVVLRMLSRDAASLFGRNGLTIDYLHIDGDHSKAGVIADLMNYAPLTSEGAVISLHDFRLVSVREAVAKFLADNPGWDRLVFEEIGTGCCFLRRQLPAGAHLPKPRTALPPRMLPPEIYHRADNAEHEDPELNAKFERWPYLESPGFRLRYEIAARFVDDPEKSVVEIGGFPNSVMEFLEHCKCMYAVEPYLPQTYETKVRILAEKRAASVAFFKGTPGNCALRCDALGRFNLFALGFDLSEGIENETAAYQDLRAMAELMTKAETTVIEMPQYEASQIAWECLEKSLRPNKHHEMVLDLREDPSAQEFLVTDGRAMRRILVLKGCSPRDPEVIEAILKQGAADLVKLKPAPVIQGNPDYTLGELIRFGKEGSCAKYLRRGWSYLEDGFVWCQGVASRLELLLADQAVDPQAEYLLQLQAWPAGKTPEHPAQRLTISINGEVLFDQKLVLGRHELSVPVNGTVLAKNNPVEILFRHPEAVQPSLLFPEGNGDQRTLAFACESLCLAPHQA
jgi:hypothetical protein